MSFVNDYVQTLLNGDNEISKLRVQPSDQKILVVGYSYVKNKNITFTLARYNTDLSIDTTFNSTGFNILPITNYNFSNAFNLDFQTDNYIVVVGYARDTNIFVVARFTTNGILDTTFNSSGIQPGVITTLIEDSCSAFGVRIQSNDNKIVVCGSSTGEVIRSVLVR